MIISDAMLNSVLYGAERDWVLNVHWLHALAAATIIVSFAPSSSSAAKSTAYDTDIVEPLVASGRLTLSAEARDEKQRSAVNSTGFPTLRGTNKTRMIRPAAKTVLTKTRAATGRSFIMPAGELGFDFLHLGVRCVFGSGSSW